LRFPAPIFVGRPLRYPATVRTVVMALALVTARAALGDVTPPAAEPPVLFRLDGKSRVAHTVLSLAIVRHPQDRDAPAPDGSVVWRCRDPMGDTPQLRACAAARGWYRGPDTYRIDFVAGERHDHSVVFRVDGGERRVEVDLTVGAPTPLAHDPVKIYDDLYVTRWKPPRPDLLVRVDQGPPRLTVSNRSEVYVYLPSELRDRVGAATCAVDHPVLRSGAGKGETMTNAVTCPAAAAPAEAWLMEDTALSEVTTFYVYPLEAPSPRR
jgi:hypothetical protein